MVQNAGQEACESPNGFHYKRRRPEQTLLYRIIEQQQSRSFRTLVREFCGWRALIGGTAPT
jgi:hypothetical protein|tara:strand:+ start:195 stop:377 length:183 start_codon:yes stop_codon:yes gene_type:complete